VDANRSPLNLQELAWKAFLPRRESHERLHVLYLTGSDRTAWRRYREPLRQTNTMDYAYRNIKPKRELRQPRLKILLGDFQSSRVVEETSSALYRKIPPFCPSLVTSSRVDTSPANFALNRRCRRNICLYPDAYLPPLEHLRTGGDKRLPSVRKLFPLRQGHLNSLFSTDLVNLEVLKWLQCQSEVVNFWWENQLPHQNGARSTIWAVRRGPLKIVLLYTRNLME
jgi:hypothetical protein